MRPPVCHSVDFVSATLALLAGWYTYRLAFALVPGKVPKGLQLEPIQSKGWLKVWLMGHLTDWLDRSITHEQGAQLLNYCRDLNRPTAVRLSTSVQIVTANNEDWAHVFTSKYAQYYRKGVSYTVLVRMLGRGLLTAFDDATHDAHRRVVAPAFAPASLKRMADEVMTVHALRLVERLNDKIHLEQERLVADDANEEAQQPPLGRVLVQDAIFTTAVHIMSQAAFKTTSESTTKKVADAFTEMLSHAYSPPRLLWLADMLMLRSNAVLRRGRSTLQCVAREISTLHLHSKERHHNDDDDDARAGQGAIPTNTRNRVLLDFLLESPTFSEQDVVDHSLTFMFAGSDTTSNAMTWLVYYLAAHPKCQDVLYEELCAVTSLDGVATIEDLKGCRYLMACIKENLRMMNPVHVLDRRCEEDDVLPGTKQFVPKGTVVVFSLYAMHWSRAVWGEDANEFRPERWDQPLAQEAERAGYFVPFSTGRRNCIGKDFAMLEMQLLAAAVFRSFKVGWPLNTPRPERTNNPVVKPKEPLQVFLEKRSQ